MEMSLLIVGSFRLFLRFIYFFLIFKYYFQKIPYEEIVKLHTRDLLSYSGTVGVLNRFGRFCSVTLKVS